MKKITAILLTLCFFTLSSCSSDDPAPTNEDAELYIRFSANNQQYSFEPETITSLQKLINGYTFVDNSLTRVSLWMPVVPTMGTHQLQNESVNDNNINTLYRGSFWLGDNIYEATTGSVTITAMDADYIKGTFSFTGTTSDGATMTISNGTFRAYN